MHVHAHPNLTIPDLGSIKNKAQDIIEDISGDLYDVNASLINSVNEFIKANTKNKSARVNATALPTISPATKGLIDDLKENYNLPKPLLTLHDKIKTLEETAKRLIDSEKKLAEATANKVKDRIVGMFATTSAVSLAVGGLLGGIALGGAAGIVLGIAGGAAFLILGGIYHRIYPLTSKDSGLPCCQKDYGLWASLIFAGALLPAIDAFRKIPLLILGKNELQSIVKEQKDIVMKDFSELFDYYRKMQAELNKLEKIAQTFIQKIESFLMEIVNKVSHLASEAEQLVVLQKIRVHQEAVKELDTVKNYYAEFSKL